MALVKDIAFGKRSIKDGSKYDQYFTQATGRTINMGNNPVVENVEQIIPRVVNEFKEEARGIADVLYNADREVFLRNIWNFMFSYIQYEYDKPGKEQFRTPARSWNDRESGIDCDCFSIFISCILTLHEIPHYIRITSYDYNPDFQHIYVIVEKEGIPFNALDNSSYFTIDAVVHKFNSEKVFTKQKTYSMDGLGIVTEVLNGIDEDQSIVSGILNGTGLAGESNPDQVYRHLVATRNWAIKNPGLLRMQGEEPEHFMRKIDYAIENFWKGEKVREDAFQNLARAEARQNQLDGFTEEELESVEGFADDIDNFVDDDDVYDFDGLGLGRLSRAERKKRRNEKKRIRRNTRANRKAERKSNKASRKKERREAKGFFRKVGVTLKQGGKSLFVKANPAVIASRTGFLTAVRLNMFKLASRLKYGYKTEAEALKAGVNYKAAKEMRKRIEAIFADKLGGKRSALQKAVLMSKASLKGIDEQDWEGIAVEFSGVEGLNGATAVTAVLSAVPILVKVINEISAVEDEYGLEGLGYLGTIHEDAEELYDLMFEMDSQMDGLAGGKQVNADMVIAWVKQFFSKLKERRAERSVEKKSMSKQAWKSYKKKSRAMRKDERKRSNANASEFNTFKSQAAAFTKSMDAEEDGNAPELNTSIMPGSDLVRSTSNTKSEATAGNKKKLFIGLGILGGIGIIGGVAYAASKKKKEEKTLEGLNKSKSKTKNKKTTKVELK